MPDIKLTLLDPKSHYAASQTDLSGYLNRPLSTSGCTILICNRGLAIVSINFRKQTLRKGDIVFLFSDTIFIAHRTSRNFMAFYCAVSSELLVESTYNIAWDFYGFLYRNPICHATAEEYSQIELWQQQVAWFVSESIDGEQYPFIRNSLQNLLLGVDRELKRNPELLGRSPRKDSAWALMNRFYTLIIEHGLSQRSVRFYADKLCITPYYLSKVTDSILRQSPKEIIDEQILVEIKMHLSCTNMSVKQIAEKLSFDDPSYLCRFFRRHTGKSLTDYRAEFL